jgi:hypothetical protein
MNNSSLVNSYKVDNIEFFSDENKLNGAALSYRLDDREFESRQELGILLFTITSIPALGPTQLPIQWVSGVLWLGVKRPGHEDDHLPPSGAEVKNAWSYTFTPPIFLHGVVLS